MNKITSCFAVFITCIGLINNVKGTIHTVGASGQNFTTIQAANNDAGVANGDTLIIMDPILTEGDILIDKDLAIIGYGEGSVIQAAADSGTASTRVLKIAAGTDVELYNLTIRHGVDTAGGGIFNEGTLLMHECTIEKNVAESNPPYGGGGLYSGSPSMELSQCTFHRNLSTGHGGGINNFNPQSVVTVDNCTFTDNIAHW